MDKTKKSNIIVFSVVIAVLTAISMGLMSAIIMIPPPSNGGATIMLWMCGVILGLYLAIFMQLLVEK